MTAVCYHLNTGIMSMSTPDSDNRRESELFRAAQHEIDTHKWFESEKAGRDMGRDAVMNWKCTHWWRWCRARLTEHLSGTKYWSELDQKDYGLINRDFHPNKDLAKIIVEKIRNNGENLEVIFWAQETGQNMKDVLEILNLLDINSRRISFFIE
jgi:hypothetical protein